jgi:hypothetical protein
MRKRQINNYCGGFRNQRGGGVTISWNTTPINTMPTNPNKPLNPINPSNPNIPIIPTPLPDINNPDWHITPPNIPLPPNTPLPPMNNNKDKYIAALVGLGTMSATLLGAAAYISRRSAQIEINEPEAIPLLNRGIINENRDVELVT